MVAPTPSFNIGVDLGDLPQNVRDIKDAIGDPAVGTSIVGDLLPLATTAYVTAAVAPLARTADVTAAVAPLATKEDIERVRASIAESSAIGVDLGDLPQNVRDIKDAIGDPAVGTSIVGDLLPLATTAYVTAAVAPLARTADVTAAVAPLATKEDIEQVRVSIAESSAIGVDLGDLPQNVRDIKDAIGDPAVGTSIVGDLLPLATTAYVTAAVAPLATKEDIEQVRASIAESTAELRSLISELWWCDGCAGLVYEQVGLNDAARHESVTVEEFSKAAEQHHVRHLLPRDPSAIESLLQIVKSYHATRPSPPPPTKVSVKRK